MAAATEVALIDLFNPVFLARAVSRIGRDYWRAVATIGALCLSAGVLQILVAALAGEGFVAAVLRGLVVTYACLAGARAAGSVLYLHGHAIGWGAESAYQVAVLQPISDSRSCRDADRPVDALVIPAGAGHAARRRGRGPLRRAEHAHPSHLRPRTIPPAHGC